MARRYCLLTLCGLVVFLLDQASKWLIVKTIPEYRSVTVIAGFFDLVNIRNRGAAFGFLNRSDIEWQFWLFLAATIAAFIAILVVVKGLKEKSTLLVVALGGILGGAFGNLLDRLRMRAVVDFVDLYWRDWHWPAFNVADTAICLGAVVVGILMLKGQERKASE
ncbi:MAG: signal peptidase II [Desulfovibrio sp.]|nr:signal peptidase II [Desulfovibrio sp.]